MTDKILVDWDIPFEEFRRKYIEVFNVRARELLGPSVKSIGYVRSSSGNTHIVVYLSEPIPERDAVIYAALMGSDFRRECLIGVGYTAWVTRNHGSSMIIGRRVRVRSQ